MKKLLVIAVILVGPTAKGCSCRVLEPKEALRQYDAVFSGQVSDVSYVDDPNDESPRIKVTVKVVESWKGPRSKNIEMWTIRRDRACKGLSGSQLVLGQKLLIYAKRLAVPGQPKIEAFTTDICSRTDFIQGTVKDLEFLGKGRLPR